MVDADQAQLVWHAALLSGDPPDAAFVHKAQAGDTAAFEALLQRHAAMVLRTARGILGHHEDAQDAAQEVFIRLHRYLHHADGTRPLEPWLYRMTVNVCRDAGRKRARHRARPLDAAADRPAPDPAADAVMAQTERHAALHDALDCLTPRERTAVVLRDLEELSTRDVARTMGCFEVTVRTYLRRARLKLKRHYDTHGDRHDGM